MSLIEKINADIKTAMKEKNKEKLTALRAVKSELLLLQTQSGDVKITEADELKIIKKLVKQRNDSAVLYEEQGRNDLAENERKELSYIEPFLPKQMSEEELKEFLSGLINELGVSSVSEIGKVMGVAIGRLSGKADNKHVSSMVRELLS